MRSMANMHAIAIELKMGNICFLWLLIGQILMSIWVNGEKTIHLGGSKHIHEPQRARQARQALLPFLLFGASFFAFKSCVFVFCDLCALCIFTICMFVFCISVCKMHSCILCICLHNVFCIFAFVCILHFCICICICIMQVRVSARQVQVAADPSSQSVHLMHCKWPLHTPHSALVTNTNI